MQPTVFITIPAYNAGATLERVFARLPEAVRDRIEQYVVVNDGSRDDTDEVLARLKLSYGNLAALRHEVNRGYGGAMKTLLGHALEHGAGIVIVLHADGQYSPEKIPELVEPIERGDADMVQGSRMLGGEALAGGMPLYKYVANKTLTAIENLAFGLGMAEYHSGYMLYSRRALEAIPFHKLSDSFDFDLEMIVMSKVKKLRLKEVPIPTIYADEVSHLKPIPYGMRVLSVVWKYLRGKYHAL